MEIKSMERKRAPRENFRGRGKEEKREGISREWRILLAKRRERKPKTKKAKEKRAKSFTDLKPMGPSK